LLESRNLLSGLTGLTRQIDLSATVSPLTSAAANPRLAPQAFDGINAYQQRFANGGNQFDVEPPDEGLAVGNGYVVNAVNDAIRVYDKSGTPLTDVVDLNTFFSYPDELNQTTGAIGPAVTDPSVYFDHATQRWFLDELTYEVDPVTGIPPSHVLQSPRSRREPDCRPPRQLEHLSLAGAERRQSGNAGSQRPGLQ
jgi:hypothetical protein